MRARERESAPRASSSGGYSGILPIPLLLAAGWKPPPPAVRWHFECQPGTNGGLAHHYAGRCDMVATHLETTWQLQPVLAEGLDTCRQGFFGTSRPLLVFCGLTILSSFVGLDVVRVFGFRFVGDECPAVGTLSGSECLHDAKRYRSPSRKTLVSKQSLSVYRHC